MDVFKSFALSVSCIVVIAACGEEVVTLKNKPASRTSPVAPAPMPSSGSGDSHPGNPSTPSNPGTTPTDPTQPTDPVTPPPGQTAFSFADIQPIMQRYKCTRCHEEFSEYAGVMDYVEASNSQASMIYLAVLTGDMPPRGNKLTKDELNIFKQWIDQGAKE